MVTLARPSERELTAHFAHQIGGAYEAGSLGSKATMGKFNAVALHGLLGGTMSVANGGKFGHGFAAGAAGKAFMFGLQATNLPLYSQGSAPGSFSSADFHHVAARTAIAAVIGGTVSEIGGGTFANGARTAAMQHLFNAEHVDDPANNKWEVFKREIADWWTGNDTQDLRDGIGLAVDIVAIKSRPALIGSNIHTGIEFKAAMAAGSHADAAIIAVSWASPSAANFIFRAMPYKSDYFQGIVSIGISKGTEAQLSGDCLNQCTKYD